MLISLRSIVIAMSPLALVPLIACGGSVNGTGGGGNGSGTGGETNTTTTTGSTTGTGSTTPTGTTTGTSADLCIDYCDSRLACVDPAECVLADAAGAKTVCETGCAKGLAVLSMAEHATLKTCLDCMFSKAAPGTCFEELPFDSCKAQCDSSAVDNAAEKWIEASVPPPGDTKGLCTNGKSIFEDISCTAGASETECSLECCNGSCGATPDVGVECQTPGSGPSSCTCTAGKNKGKTFQAPDPCGGDVWNQCNL